MIELGRQLAWINLIYMAPHPGFARLNRASEQRFRTRSGALWNPVSVFNLLPRLIEVGPRIFSNDERQERKERLPKTM